MREGSDSESCYRESTVIILIPVERGHIMKLAAVALSVALGTAGAAALPAASAFAVDANTSYINFDTMPPSHQAILCHYGATHKVAEGGTNINDVNNKCDVRLWLHQYLDGGGKAMCITPGKDVLVDRFAHWRQILVSSNKKKC